MKFTEGAFCRWGYELARDECAVFEATHGTAPKYAGQDKVNPGSLILSGAMMLDHMGWGEAAALAHHGLTGAIQQKKWPAISPGRWLEPRKSAVPPSAEL